MLAVLGSSRPAESCLERGNQEGDALSERSTELKDKFSRKQPTASGQKRRWESGARHFFGNDGFAIGDWWRLDSNPTTLGRDRTFLDRPLCLWQFRQLEDGPLSLMMAVLETL